MSTSPRRTVLSSRTDGRHLTSCSIRRKRQQQRPSFCHLTNHLMLQWIFFVYSSLAMYLGIPLRTVVLKWHFNEYLMKKEVIGRNSYVTYLPNQIYVYTDAFPTDPCRAQTVQGWGLFKGIANCHQSLIRRERVVVDEFQPLMLLF